jgi:16S rRNA (adenine1518-N6/adenine1519-N6)-dimethyltransferase
MSPRQTASYLKQRLGEAGLQPDARHGQNFLIDLNLLELLARTADVGPDDVVLEVGTGTGALTAMLAANAAAVVTVEIDAHLFQLASEVLAPRANVTMLHQDALRNKNNFHPAVLAAVRDRLAAAPGLRFKLAANLPYNIATPVISNLLLTDLKAVSLTVTIQKELADRIIARPRTKDYGALSVWIQSQCDAEVVRVLPPTVFWPRPKVHSAIVHITPEPERRARIPDVPYFHGFVRAMFFHRRKFLRSVILSAFKGRLDKPQVDEVLARLQLGGQCRAEELTVDELLVLCALVREKAGHEPPL